MRLSPTWRHSHVSALGLQEAPLATDPFDERLSSRPFVRDSQLGPLLGENRGGGHAKGEEGNAVRMPENAPTCEALSRQARLCGGKWQHSCRT